MSEAEANLLKGVELAELATPMRSGDLLDGYHALACLRCIERDFEGAFAWMDKAERTCTWVQEGVRALQVRIWLWRAQTEMDHHYLDLALAWARERNLENPARNEWELQSLAQAYIAGYRAYGEPDLAPLLGVLGEQLRLAEAADRDDLVIYMLVLEALARQALGQMDQAMNSLARALATRCSPWLCHDLCVSRGANGGAAPGGRQREGFQRAYVERLLAAFSQRQCPSGFLPTLVPCKLLCLNRSASASWRCSAFWPAASAGPQIADELFISLGTFQTHTKSIYGKLGVHNRIEAIERARDLKLI